MSNWRGPYQAPSNPTPAETELANLYQLLRLNIEGVEELLDNPDNFDARAIKRLDKSVTVLKAGVKTIKKVLKSRGFSELKPKFIVTQTDLSVVLAESKVGQIAIRTGEKISKGDFLDITLEADKEPVLKKTNFSETAFLAAEDLTHSCVLVDLALRKVYNSPTPNRAIEQQ